MKMITPFCIVILASIALQAQTYDFTLIVSPPQTPYHDCVTITPQTVTSERCVDWTEGVGGVGPMIEIPLNPNLSLWSTLIDCDKTHTGTGTLHFVGFKSPTGIAGTARNLYMDQPKFQFIGGLNASCTP